MSECACYPAQKLCIVQHAHWDEMLMGASWDRHLGYDSGTPTRILSRARGPACRAPLSIPLVHGRLGLGRYAPSHHRAGPQRRLASPLPLPSRPHDPRVGSQAAVTRTLIHITPPPSLPFPLPQQRHAMHGEKMMLSWWDGSLIPFSDVLKRQENCHELTAPERNARLGTWYHVRTIQRHRDIFSLKISLWKFSLWKFRKIYT